jgi:hypothetical protein
MEMIIRRVFMRGATLSALIVVSACAVPDLEKPLADFSAATEDAEVALVTLNDEVTSAYGDLLKQKVLDGKALVVFPSGECLSDSERCQLVLAGDGGALSPDPALSEMILLMGSIRGYAAGLAAIATADTVDKVETQVNATVASVLQLAKTLDALGQEDQTKLVDMAEYATPTGQFVNWFAGQYIAQAKLSGLKRATTNAKDIVAESANIFGEAGNIAATAIRSEMAKTVGERKNALDDKLTEANLEKLIDSALAYDRFLIAKPSNVFRQMVVAHNALVDRLQGEDMSLAQAIAQIQLFAAEAKILSNILKDFKAIAEAQDTDMGEK